ncbi:Type I antifreeze protein [Legionella lansingensis]|uniref:Zinc ribbon domain protein n=1 Tax=Legionella lansingensis TaxID=45067 RepID=A0A0W0VEJ3_9GAMM|nr:zinc ribbon domain-containing protein [Legionella lansingensis]KTD18544.1 Zinc ribbon domain protein [Legionella lansingensis]SNV50918.1 Type I antifreeze protein [Legionella lansingensis]
MPIYEYECKSCHHHFDLMQKVSDAPVKQCPQCFEDTAVRLVSAAGFQLKGTGWYATDFKNKDNKKEAKTTTEGSSTADKKPADSPPPVKSEKKGDKD